MMFRMNVILTSATGSSNTKRMNLVAFAWISSHNLAVCAIILSLSFSDAIENEMENGNNNHAAKFMRHFA